MSADTELLALIDKLTTENTFSLAGVKAIENLKVRAEQLDMKVKGLQADLDVSKAARDRGDTAYKKVSEERDRLIAQKEAWEKREANIVAIEKDAAVAMGKAEAYRWSMETVFRPNAIREIVNKSIPLTSQPGHSLPSGQYQPGTVVSNYTESSDTTKIEGS